MLLTDSLRIAFTDQVATEFLGAIVDELAPTGLALTLLTSSGNAAVIPARDVALDGAIVYSCRAESVAQDWLMRRKLPVVFVDQRPQPGVASVNVDDRGGAWLAAQHVIDLGHRRVGVLNATADGAPAAGEDPLAGVRGYPPRQRMLGWLDALRPAGISPAVAHTRNDSIEEAAQAARSLLELNERPTAVLCFSDVLALGVLRAASELGLHVPADVSVVGFDDSPAAQDSDPPLTTVRQDVTEKGRLAARALTEAMEGGRTGRPARIAISSCRSSSWSEAAPRARTTPLRRRPDGRRRDTGKPRGVGQWSVMGGTGEVSSGGRRPREQLPTCIRHG